MIESTAPLKANGVPFRHMLFVTLKETNPSECKRCCGSGEIGTGWFDDDIRECPVCRGRKTVDLLRHASPDPKLEEYLGKCMDEYLREKYVQ